MNIDRYEVERQLGSGGTSRVYLARDPKLDRRVAIKVLGSGADEETRRRFRLEAKAIATLKHPNIVEIYDYAGEGADDLYLVLELIDGRSLYHFIAEHGPMTEPTALCVAHELCLALEHAHAHHVVHRDLKPENVLLSEGRVVLTDFGTVKAVAHKNSLGAEDRPRTAVLGTPGFMAPEQFAGTKIGPQTDLFALGATLYNLTTGRVPYEGRSVDAIYKNLRAGKYEPPDATSPLLSPDFCRLLSACLAPKATKRVASASELRPRILEQLERVGITEVRSELQRYQARPALAAVEQRERSIGVLMRDLKVALKDKDGTTVADLVQRIQTLAPLDERIYDLSGIKPSLPASAKDAPVARRSWAGPFLLGVAVGAAGLWGLLNGGWLE